MNWKLIISGAISVALAAFCGDSIGRLGGPDSVAGSGDYLLWSGLPILGSLGAAFGAYRFSGAKVATLVTNHIDGPGYVIDTQIDATRASDPKFRESVVKAVEHAIALPPQTGASVKTGDKA